MAGTVRATLQMHVGAANITPDRCPGSDRLLQLEESAATPQCWNTTELWGSSYCPFLLHVSRSHRITSRYADPLHAVDEKHSADKVVGRVACHCQLAKGDKTLPGA